MAIRASNAAVYTLLLFLALSGAACSRQPAPVAATAAPEAGDTTPSEPTIAVTDDMGDPHIGDPAPTFTLTDQGGKTVSSESLRGSVVMLAFVASFCPFSEAEQPNLKALADEYRGKNVKVVAVDVNEDDAGYQKYLGRVAMPFPVLRDKSGDVTRSFAPPLAQPNIKDRSLALVTSNLVLDEAGTIRFFTLADTVHFDARLVHARRAIDALLAKEAAR